jgi:hypothetical protein
MIETVKPKITEKNNSAIFDFDFRQIFLIKSVVYGEENKLEILLVNFDSFV